MIPLFFWRYEKIKPKRKNNRIVRLVKHIFAAFGVKALFVFKMANIKEMIIPKIIQLKKDILKLSKDFFIFITYQNILMK